MKIQALILSAIWLLLAAGVTAEPDRNAIVRLQELVLPEFVVEGASLKEGLAIVKAAWDKQYPDKSFPVVVLESLEYKSDSKLGATMSLKNIPALTVVTYLGEVHAMTVRHGLDLVVLRPVIALDEGAWASVMLNISDVSSAALRLSPAADGDKDANEALKKSLVDLGLTFESGFDVRWFGGSSQLFMRNTPEEVSKLKGLVMLFDAGYSVSKAAGKKRGEQDGARQPATAPDSKSEGDQKPKPESEGRSQ